MINKIENLDLKQRVQIICLYFSRLESKDLRRSKIISRYRELEVLSGIKANTIRQWTDSFDPYFDNGRKGYYQRDLEHSNKSLWNVYKKYGQYSVGELQEIVTEVYETLDKNSYSLNIGGNDVYLYSIKTKKEETSTSLYSLEDSPEIVNFTLRIDNLNRYNPRTSKNQQLKVGDLLFLSLGGDNEKWKRWENGLTAVGKVEAIYTKDFIKDYEIETKVLLKLPIEITPSDLYYYPDTSNEFNIGPSLKGTPNQAINRVSTKGALSIFSAICDIFPEYKNSIRRLIGDENFLQLDKVPKLRTTGEYEEETRRTNLELDFEGSDDLIDKVNLLSDENYRENSQDLELALHMDRSDEGYKAEKKELMSLPANELKRKLSVTQRELSISDIKKFYDRFSGYEAEYLYINKDKDSEGINYSNLGDALILEPDFQREYVWKKDKKQQLIDSLLLGIPIPTFYFSIDKNGNLLVVDGKQRINSILEFLDGQLSLPPTYRFLCLDKETTDEVYFSDLESRIKRKLEDYPLTCYLVDSSVIPRFQNEIFMRVNRGGERLTIQEIRNASNVGKVTSLLNKISKNKELQIVPIKRKKDQYLVLRFFAYYLIHNSKVFNSIYNFEAEYNGIDNLLDKVMKYINIINDSEVSDLYSLYDKYLRISKQMFGLKSYKDFSRIDSNSVNMVIFESWMLLISNFSITVIEDKLELFFNKYIEFVSDSKFVDNILYRRDSKEKVLWRFNYIKKNVDDLKHKLGM